MSDFTEEEIAHCKAAMDKGAPIDALRLIASGRVEIELTEDGRYVTLLTLDGERVRDPDFPDDRDRKVGLAGAWPLFRAGMIDKAGRPTELGIMTLKAHPSSLVHGLPEDARS